MANKILAECPRCHSRNVSPADRSNGMRHCCKCGKQFQDDKLNLVPVTVGGGKKIHAATVRLVKVGRRHTRKVYFHICGSGKSSFAHSFRTPVGKIAYDATLEDVNCAKCLKAMEGLESDA